MGVYSLEEYDDTTTDEESEILEVPEEEMNDTSDSDIIQNEIEESIDDAISLEEMLDTIHGFKENGGMSKETAMVVHHSVAGFAKRNKLALPRNFSTEAFDTASGRQQATTWSMEGITDTLKKWWENIKKWLAKLVKAIVSFWEKHASRVGRLLKAAKILSKKAEDHKGAKDKNDVMVRKNIVAALRKGNSTSFTESEVLSGMKELQVDLKRVGDESPIAEELTNAAKLLNEMDIKKIEDFQVYNGGKHFKELNDHVTLIKGNLPGGKVAVNGEKVEGSNKLKPSVKGNLAYVYGAELIGTSRVIFTIRAKDNIFESITGSVVDLGDKLTKDEYKISALETGQIAALCDGIVNLLEVVQEQKINYKERADIVDEIKKAGDKAMKGIEEYADEARKAAPDIKKGYQRCKSTIMFTAAMTASVMEPQKSLHGHSFTVAAAAYTYARECFGNLKTK